LQELQLFDAQEKMMRAIDRWKMEVVWRVKFGALAFSLCLERVVAYSTDGVDALAFIAFRFICEKRRPRKAPTQATSDALAVSTTRSIQ
jgi:hypothetical protein